MFDEIYGGKKIKWLFGLESNDGRNYILAYKTVDDVNGASYGVCITNVDTGLENVVTTFEEQENTFNAIMRKYGVTDGKLEFFR